MGFIDFHTHIFPDHIARQAIDTLAKDAGDYQPRSDGTLKGLLASMDRAGIDKSVVANIATRPSQIQPIFEFCREIRSERIIPLISFHPKNNIEDVETIFGKAKELGIKGVKLHPMYQEFFLDDSGMFEFYRLVESFDFLLVFHTGYDIAFPGNTQADVERVKTVADLFQNLTIVTTHVGGWRQWDRANVLSGCSNVYTETSMTLTEIGEDQFIRILSSFGEDRILFGSDSPWTDQNEMIERTMQLKIPDRMKEKMLYKNAERLLGL